MKKREIEKAIRFAIFYGQADAQLLKSVQSRFGLNRRDALNALANVKKNLVSLLPAEPAIEGDYATAEHKVLAHLLREIGEDV